MKTVAEKRAYQREWYRKNKSKKVFRKHNYMRVGKRAKILEAVSFEVLSCPHCGSLLRKGEKNV